MGADFSETNDDLVRNDREGCIQLGIGSGSLIDGAILDKNVRLGRHVQVVNKLGLVDSDQFDPCYVREGIPILTKDATLVDGWTMGKAQ